IDVHFRIMASPQIHYKHCDRRFNCIIPSKYFDRADEKALLITTETKKPFRDGLEIHVAERTKWFLTLMANNSKSEIEVL
ncbi:hypothetical protein PMAYCL1PPCAC_22828, partial [Pristionchus mayeri]